MSPPRYVLRKPYEEYLVSLASRVYVGKDRPDYLLQARLLRLWRRAYWRLSTESRRQLRFVRSADPPRDVVSLIRMALGLAALRLWIRAHFPEVYFKLGWGEIRVKLVTWLETLPTEKRHDIYEAAIRYAVLPPNESDQNLLKLTIGQFLISKEDKMTEYYFDIRTLPDEFGGDDGEESQEAYLEAVTKELESSLGITSTDPDHEMIVAVMTGELLLDERFDPQAYGFDTSLHRAWYRFLEKTFDKDGKLTVPNREIYKKIVEILPDLPGRSDAKVSYREFAYVGRAVIAEAHRIPIDHPSFPAQVSNAFDEYVAGEPTFGTLMLPALTVDADIDNEIQPDNIEAVAMIYAAYQLEQIRLFDVVDRITELFMNGLLPLGLDDGGRILDRYYWESEDRMNATVRFSHYSRVLGVVGGDISKEIQPNVGFNNLLMRFLSSVAEYDRQQRMADIFQQSRSLSTTGEYVRKSGRDLAANASLYGWASAHFAARRMNNHIADALGILKNRQVQQAYAVSTPWQVIEQVAAREFGQTPNIVRLRTMAEAGKKILDLVAKYGPVWNGTDKPLFQESLSSTSGLAALLAASGATTTLPSPQADFSAKDQELLMIQTQYWLAVNGIKDAQVEEYSQPTETPAARSIPGGDGSIGNGAMDQVRQMVSQGQMPSMEQLQGLLGTGSIGI